MPGGVVSVQTTDDVRLALHRIRPEGEGGPAVLLLHGLASNRHALHFPERSLARYLASRGFDCFVAELRGCGASERPRRPWTVDDYLQYDLPAILATIAHVNGREQVMWVGHSLGGVLLLAYAALHPELPLASGVTLGSALDLRPGKSSFRKWLPLKPVLNHLSSVRFGDLLHWLAPVSGRAWSKRFDQVSVWPPNIEACMTRRMHAIGFENAPCELLLSLESLLGEQGFTVQAGRRRIVAEARSIKVPLLMFAGSEDRQTPAAAVLETSKVLGGAVTVRILGKAHGEQEEYGHWDMVIGARAPMEVWPALASFLLAHTP